MPRTIKRLIIIAIYLLIFGGIFMFFYLLHDDPVPTCFDGVRNQGEKEIDCGGPCNECVEDFSDAQDLVVVEKHFVPAVEGSYDVVVRVKNPNPSYGSASYDYIVSLRDAQDDVLGSRVGTGFILPTEEKYIVIPNVKASMRPARVHVEIEDPTWSRFTDYEKPELRIYNKRYNPVSSGPAFSEAFGLLRNESPFDFRNINIYVILKDGSGSVVAAHKTDFQTLDAGEERDFRLLWPQSFSGTVDLEEGIIMEAEANVFDSKNFVKKHLLGGQFQELQNDDGR